jgi:hypothetical protein
MGDPLQFDTEAQIDRARLVFEIFLESYEAGEITFESLARIGKKVSEKLPEGFGLRRKALGSLLWRALDVTPRKRRRGQHGAIRTKVVSELTKTLVSAVSEGEGWAKTSPRTYKKVIAIWDAAGVKLSLDQVRDSCRPR